MIQKPESSLFAGKFRLSPLGQQVWRQKSIGRRAGCHCPEGEIRERKTSKAGNDRIAEFNGEAIAEWKTMKEWSSKR